MLKYACDHCGACCEGRLIVEADDLDVLRESRLIQADRYHAGKSVETILHEIRHEWKAVILAGPNPCPFLADEKSCTIYPTRPQLLCRDGGGRRAVPRGSRRRRPFAATRAGIPPAKVT